MIVHMINLWYGDKALQDCYVFTSIDLCHDSITLFCMCLTRDQKT